MTVNQNREFNSGMDGDATDGLANVDKQVIDIYHIPSDKNLSFKAYLTSFTDQYSSEWNSESVFGRMDPIQTFKSTNRIISLGWDVPSSCFTEASDNLEKASLLLSMLYPQYEKGSGGATTMSSPPLFKIKFLNLIQDSVGFAAPAASAKSSGLLGTIAGLTYEPDLDAGFFQPSVQRMGAHKLFPKTIKFQAQFTVLHQHKLGWTEADPNRACGFDSFPYSVPLPQPPPLKAINLNPAPVVSEVPPVPPAPYTILDPATRKWVDPNTGKVWARLPAPETDGAQTRHNAAAELKLGDGMGGCS